MPDLLQRYLVEPSGELHNILQRYWGYRQFRPLQEEIISSVLEGKDTLALMPTGGGKSICYQVPALMRPGLCLVISPLIALMKDQVEGLQQKGVRALAVFSGMSAREVDVTFDNAVYGEYKFLFLSPERLESDIFLQRVANMPVSLIAVDEAHCISEWGYDFRPAYLKIAEIRKFFPNVPVLALTATATPDVQKDIMEKLSFKEENSSFFKMSFDRKNLIYAVLDEEDKRGRIKTLLDKVPGSAIIYVRNRRTTRELALYLQQQGISAEYYHGGLLPGERSEKQSSWKRGQTRVMVCTNAFGMGIDKADVRQVLHYDIPESLEAYYQEAGRAGRDGKKSFAILLGNDSDKTDLLDKLELTFPTVEEVRNIYHALGNFFQLPVGAGQGQSFDFQVQDFILRYNIPAIKIYNAFRILERTGYISLSEAFNIPARFMFMVDYTSLYSFEIANKKFDPLLKMLLRSYGGCFESYVPMDEKAIAGRMTVPLKQVTDELKELKRLNILDYQPQKNLPQLTFTQERMDRGNIVLDYAFLALRKKVQQEKVESMIRYAFTQGKCRSRMLLGYFGENTEEDCGHCDYCLKHKNASEAEVKIMKTRDKILEALRQGPLDVEKLLHTLNEGDRKNTLVLIRRMIDDGLIARNNQNILQLIQ